jgi:hypothetical protein
MVLLEKRKGVRGAADAAAVTPAPQRLSSLADVLAMRRSVVEQKN